MPWERIAHLIQKEDFCFQSWSDRHGSGIWAALGTTDTPLNLVHDLSSAGDLDMIPAMEYVRSAQWLPYVTGETFEEAMQQLEDRLARLPPDQLTRNSPWSRLVDETLAALDEATRGCSWYDAPSRQPLPLKPLPATFEQALVGI